MLKDSNNKIAFSICKFSVIVNINVLKHQNYGNSDGLQSLTGYFANGVVLMLDWTIPQCNKIPKKSLIYRKLQKQNPRALYLNTSLNRQALNELI